MTLSIRLSALTLGAAYALTLAAALPLVAPERAVIAALTAPALVWLSVTDLDRHIIPDTATAWVALIGAVWRWREGDLWPALALGLALAGALWLLGGIAHRRRGQEALGIGDAKLIGAGVLLTGVWATPAMLFLAATGGIAAALMARARGRAINQGLAFGPFLAYSMFIVTMFPFPGANPP